jgi:large subunit ribosomal protein L7Ae
LDKAESFPVFQLLSKYVPESSTEKKARLESQAAAKVSGGTGASPAPKPTLKYGLQHITHLVENKKAKLVVIASDVEPIELVVWLPALCRRFGVAYAIVNNKGRLGALVHKKTATAVALTDVNKEDEAAFEKVIESVNSKFKDNVDGRRKWGGGIMGLKTQTRLAIREKILQVCSFLSFFLFYSMP